MKYWILLLILFLKLKVFGSCMFECISAMPYGDEISENSMIYIELYGGSRKIMDNPDMDRSIWLTSNKRKIRLKLLETKQGINTLLLVLTPEKKLKIGHSYTLRIDDFPEDLQSFSKTWKVTTKADYDPPKILSAPQVFDKSYNMFGCGPEKWVRFSFEGNDSSSIIVLCTLKDTNGVELNSYYLLTKDNAHFSIGHGMCSGAFNLGNDQAYLLDVCFVDLSGNIALESYANIRFVSAKNATKINLKTPRVYIDFEKE